VNLAKKSGYFTYWFSNQAEHGYHDSLVGGIGKQANKAIFLNQFDAANKLTKDNELLPHIQQTLISPQQKQVIFVHLFGSHSPHCLRTDNRYDIFVLNKSISCYIQS